MGVVRTESTTIGGIVYKCETFVASKAIDLYAELAAVLPEELMKIIMLPVSEIFEKRRKGDAGELTLSVAKMLVALENPGVLARVSTMFMRDAAEIPGGLSSLMKRLLRKTTADPCRIAEGMPGSEASITVHFDTHFGADLESVMHAFEVCVWVMRLNFAKPSSGNS